MTTDRDIRHRALRRTPRRAKESSADDLLRDVPPVVLDRGEDAYRLMETSLEKLCRDPSKARRTYLPKDMWFDEDHAAEAAERAAAEVKKG